MSDNPFNYEDDDDFPRSISYPGDVDDLSDDDFEFDYDLYILRINPVGVVLYLLAGFVVWRLLRRQ